jgi:hypothetical protein
MKMIDQTEDEFLSLFRPGGWFKPTLYETAERVQRSYRFTSIMEYMLAATNKMGSSRFMLSDGSAERNFSVKNPIEPS